MRARERAAMTRITVDPALAAQLGNLLQCVELCDGAGHVLGRFTPLLDPSRPEGLRPRISEEEVRRRIEEGGGRSSAEVLADLEKRA